MYILNFFDRNKILYYYRYIVFCTKFPSVKNKSKSIFNALLTYTKPSMALHVIDRQTT